MHKPLIVANWKSHKTTARAQLWVQEMSSFVSANSTLGTVVLCPPTPLLEACTHPKKAWHLGAQDVSPYSMGSYTGAVAAQTLASCGVQYCIVGHSERRKYFAETSAQVAQKVQRLLEERMVPILCVDEPYMDEQLSILGYTEISGCVIAFEPLSAIGSGARADVGLVKKVKLQLEKYGPNLAFLYGGSVSAESIGEYLLVCDGVLVGGASLESASLSSLLKAAFPE